MENQIANSIGGIHQPTLYEHALRLTNNRDDAHDLVQDTILKAARFYNNFQEGTNLYGWLFIIMKNTFINGFRRKIMEDKLVIRTEEVSSADLYLCAAANDAPGKLIISDIHKALGLIPEKYSSAFRRSFEGFKYAEIARELDIPIGTVKTRIFHARELLKKFLNQYRD